MRLLLYSFMRFPSRSFCALSNLFLVVFQLFFILDIVVFFGVGGAGGAELNIYVACNIYSVLFCSSKMHIKYI